MSTLAAIEDAHVMDMRWAVCGSSSQSPTQDVTSDMKFTDTLGAISKFNQLGISDTRQDRYGIFSLGLY